MAEPVALQIQPPNGLTSLSQIMGIANAATQLQKNRATLESDIAQRKAESGTAVIGEEAARRTLEPKVRSAEAAAKTAETGAVSAQWKLDADQAGLAMQHAGGLLTHEGIVKGDSKSSMEALMGYEDRLRALKIPEDKIRAQLAPLYMTATHNPQNLAGMIKQATVGSIAPSGQGPAMTPTYAAQGQTQAVNVNPMAPGAAPAPQTLAPAVPVTQAERTTTDALGNPAIEVTDQKTGAKSFKAPPGSNTPPLMALPAGESPDSAKPLLAARTATNEAAAKVPDQHFNNREIIRLAPSAFTGTGGDTFAKILGSVGIQATNDNAANTAQLNHFLALQTENNAKAMGANTDAARQIATTAAGSAKSPEQAIIRIAKINDAYASGLELFNKGMEAAIKNPANDRSIFAVRDFQNKWAQTFDPTAMMLHNAVQAKNSAPNAKEQLAAQKDIEEIVRAVGGKGSKGAAALGQKYHALEKLSTEGM